MNLLPQQRTRRLCWFMVILVWTGTVSVGWSFLRNYESTPGQESSSPPHWPVQSSLHRNEGQPTLIVFAHPRCPCSRATLSEFALIMARCQGKLQAEVVFYKPVGSSSTWEQTALRGSAERISGVHVTLDLD